LKAAVRFRQTKRPPEGGLRLLTNPIIFGGVSFFVLDFTFA